MLISVISDGSELSNYSVVKMLNSASKNWDAKVLMFYIGNSTGKQLENYKKLMVKRAEAVGVELFFEPIKKTDRTFLAQTICQRSEKKGATGIFIPENMSHLSEKLKELCDDLPVEEVSSDLFPSVWDLMTKKVATLNTHDTLKYAANIMLDKGIGSLIVMDRGRIAGILTEHDFVTAYTNGNGKKEKVKDVMSYPVITLDRTGNIFEACELMKKNGIKKLVIMDGEHLQGIITTTDLARLPLSISEGLNYLVSKIKELSL